MNTPVTLHIHTKSYKESDRKGGYNYEGFLITGEVRRGDEVLHHDSTITNDVTGSVSAAEECLAILLEIWAVRNTDFIPTADALPS